MSLLHDAVKKASETKHAAPSVERPLAETYTEHPLTGSSATAVSSRQDRASSRPSWSIAAVLVCVTLGTATVAYRQNTQTTALNAVDVRLTTLSSEVARLQGGQSDTASRLSGVQKELELTRSSLDGLSRTIEQVSSQTQDVRSAVRSAETRLGRLEKTLSATRSELDALSGRLVMSTASSPSEFVPAAEAQQTVLPTA